MYRLRAAGPDDAERIADLHADSWRRHYRGAYADAYLDGDIVTERRAVWSARLAEPAGSLTIIAEDADGLAGFVHVIFDQDDHWGSLIDNLHVVAHRKRGGLGTVLLTAAGDGVVDRAARPSLYLWVLEQNTAAQGFYQATGGIRGDRAEVPAPGGVAGRLTGSPRMLRYAWPDATVTGPPDLQH